MDNMISEKQIEKIVRKNTHFKLDTDWLLVEPIDYEHKYYVLMDFMKFCDTQIENFELYPLFSEISLHLANLQAITNESKYITIDKNFKTSDDEIISSPPPIKLNFILYPFSLNKDTALITFT